jgi:hypothetical protein
MHAYVKTFLSFVEKQEQAFALSLSEQSLKN